MVVKKQGSHKSADSYKIRDRYPGKEFSGSDRQRVVTQIIQQLNYNNYDIYKHQSKQE